MCFCHHLHHLVLSASYSLRLWWRIYRKLAWTKTWWAYKSPAADRGRCLASRVGGDQDLITLCHRALGWKTQTSARAKMASGLREQADFEYSPWHSNGETKKYETIKDAAKWGKKEKNIHLFLSRARGVLLFHRAHGSIYTCIFIYGNKLILSALCFQLCFL